jgi:hypothetical protein
VTNKLEKRSKTKTRLAKTDEGSRSATSIDSSGSSVYSAFTDESIRMEKGDSAAGMELSRIHEVNEARER